MSNAVSTARALRRPQLLVAAARIGTGGYNRARDLRRLTGMSRLPPPEKMLGDLIVAEEEVEAARKAGDASYDVSHHVGLLIAVIGELRLILDKRCATAV